MKSNFIDIKELPLTYISLPTKLTGDFFFDGQVTLNCKIEGIVEFASDAKVVIEKDAKINGEIKCNNIDILGEITGEIRSIGEVILRPSSKFSGQISCKNLVVYPGAILNMESHTLE